MKFLPEDFDFGPSGDWSPRELSRCASLYAQAAFDAWLKEQPVVYGQPKASWTGWTNKYVKDIDTHTAHLVGIKKIGEEGE